MKTAIAVFLGLVVAGAISGVLIGAKISRDHGGRIICTADGKMNIEIATIEGLDPHAIRQGLFYLCDPNTIGFGYANPRWVWL